MINYDNRLQAAMDERKISLKLWARKSELVGDGSVCDRHVIGEDFPNHHQ